MRPRVLSKKRLSNFVFIRKASIAFLNNKNNKSSYFLTYCGKAVSYALSKFLQH